jgi:DNA-binding transcriptional regulator LsrR (DeoR family)
MRQKKSLREVEETAARMQSGAGENSAPLARRSGGEDASQPAKPLSDEDIAQLRVAWLLSRGLPQNEIAELIGKSPPVVSRMVSKMAEDKRWLRKTVEFVPPTDLGMDAQLLMAYVHDDGLAKKLTAKYPAPFERCTVVPVDRQAKSSGVVKTAVAMAAAERVGTLIKECELKGGPHRFFVGWGPMLNHIVSLLPPVETSVRDLHIFPLLGNFSVRLEAIHDLETFANVTYYRHSVAYCANKNADIMAKNYRHAPPRSLLIPAVIAAEAGWSPQQCACVFESDRALIQTFGRFWDASDKTGVIWKPGATILTSFGGPGRDPNDVFCQLMGYTEALPSNMAGDIAGLAFDREGKPFTAQNRQIVGLRLEHLREAAGRFAAAEPHARIGAGVMVAAADRDKVASLDVLLRHGFVNELIIDEQTALTLLGHAG